MFQQVKYRFLATEEKGRRQGEYYEEKLLQKEESIKALQKDMDVLAAQIKTTEVKYDFIDDAKFERSIQDLFHMVATWCFSNFKNMEGYIPRLAIQSEVCSVLAEKILWPLAIGVNLDASAFLDRVAGDFIASGNCANQSLTRKEIDSMSGSSSNEHRWRLSTRQAIGLRVDDDEVVKNVHDHIEGRFSPLADRQKAVNRGRILRRIVRKAVEVHNQLHQQQAQYLVEWIEAGESFYPNHMQPRQEEAPESDGRVVQYCLQPLVRKLSPEMAESGTPAIVILRAIVTLEP
ncbi:MAG: hypothetical protein M1818_005534 [Claussenomyces sp. TS43310]|nr:MAG: hypothetical protein M1818_005534 [Claussenomyces sp. TS43310]